MGDARASRAADGRARLPALLGRARVSRGRRSGRRLWRLVRPAGDARRASRGATSSTRRGARVGLPPLDDVHGGISRELALVATFPQLEYPRRDRLAVGAGDRAASVGAAVRRRRAAARATTRSCWWRRAPRRTRSSGCCARRSRGWRTSRCGCWRRRTGGRPSSRSPCRRTRGSSTGSRTRGRCRRCDAVVCHAGHGTVARALASGAPVVACPPRGRHGRERGPRSAGPAWACRCRAASRRSRGVRLAVRRVLGRAELPAPAEELRDWATRHDGAARPPTRSRSSPNRTKTRKERGDCVGGP